MTENQHPWGDAVAKGPPPASASVPAASTSEHIAPGAPIPATAAPTDPKIALRRVSELEQLVRWLLGATLVAFGGWGLWLISYGIAGEFGSIAAIVISFGFFVLLERNYWLSRFMCLRITPGTSPLFSAFWLWLLGLPGLFFRSTAPMASVPVTEDAPTGPKQMAQPDGIREIAETVVFVVVLVLLLKTFLAEAFVIPTGSMATTLWGYHKNVACEQCRYPFQVNASDQVERRPPDRVIEWTCPNCRFPNRSRLAEGLDR